MITTQDVLTILLAELFQPFTIRMSSGEAMRVDHPDQVMVFRHKLVVGQKTDQLHIFSRDIHCPFLHIASLEQDERETA